MTITLTPTQERALQDAIRAGVLASVDEFIETAIEALPHAAGQFDMEPLPSLHLGGGNFFVSPSIEQLAASQGTGPITDAKVLGGLLSDDEVEELISVISSSRAKD